MGRKQNSHVQLVKMQVGTATVENSMELPQKVKNGTALCLLLIVELISYHRTLCLFVLLCICILY